jgi:transposase
MARPYSTDLRERVVRAVEGGLSRRRAAAVFGVGVTTVIDWVSVWRASGRLAARPMGGDHSSRLKDWRAWLLQRVAAVPDLTLEAGLRHRRRADRSLLHGLERSLANPSPVSHGCQRSPQNDFGIIRGVRLG